MEPSTASDHRSSATMWTPHVCSLVFVSCLTSCARLTQRMCSFITPGPSPPAGHSAPQYLQSPRTFTLPGPSLALGLEKFEIATTHLYLYTVAAAAKDGVGKCTWLVSLCTAKSARSRTILNSASGRPKAFDAAAIASRVFSPCSENHWPIRSAILLGSLSKAPAPLSTT
jgi:hypothetical protein